MVTKPPPFNKNRMTGRKYAPEFEASEKNLIEAKATTNIYKWWKERVEKGCQLKHVDKFIPKFDYEGERPWKIWVSLGALYMDYKMSVEDCEADQRTFSMVFRNLAGAGLMLDKSRFRVMEDSGGRVADTSCGTTLKFMPRPMLEKALDLTDLEA